MKKQALRLQVFPARFTSMLLLGMSMLIYASRSEAETFTEEVKLQATNLLQKTEEKLSRFISNADTTQKETSKATVVEVEVVTEAPAKKEEAEAVKEASTFSFVEGDKKLTIVYRGLPILHDTAFSHSLTNVKTPQTGYSYVIQPNEFNILHLPELVNLKLSKDSLIKEIVTKLEVKGYTIDSPIVHKIASSANSSVSISGNLPENALFLLDGKEISKAELNELAPVKIKRVEVLRGETALKKYGEKGREGVVIISTTEKAAPKELMTKNPPIPRLNKNKNLNLSKFSDDAIFILDGKQTNKAALAQVAPETIAYAEVVDEHIVKRIYGKTAPYAVIVASHEYAANASEPLYTNDPPLLIVNGQPLLNTIYPALSSVLPMSNISKVFVLKNKTATDLYGEAAKHGVIVITTKDGTMFQGVKEDFISLSSERSDRIYPNPSDGQFINIQMELKEESEVRIDVYDTSGRLVAARKPSTMRLPAGNHEVQWSPRDELSAGTYIVHLLKGKKLSTSKVVIQK